MEQKTKKSLLYTKTGDSGNTSLLGGTRVLKDHQQIEIYGQIDGLNSNIGFLISLMTIPTEEMKKSAHYCLNIQENLFLMGTILSAPLNEWAEFKFKMISDEDVSKLEKTIDNIDHQLEPLTSFILPGGHQAASQAHIVRTLTRTLERNFVTFKQDRPQITHLNTLLTYLNRLSDYFFSLARLINQEGKVKDITWVINKK